MIMYTSDELNKINIKCPNHNVNLITVNYESYFRFHCPNGCINRIFLFKDCTSLKFHLIHYEYFCKSLKRSLYGFKYSDNTYLSFSKDREDKFFEISFKELPIQNFNEEADKLIDKLNKLAIFK